MKNLYFLCSCMLSIFTSFSQDLYIYHGRKDETLIYNSKKETVSLPMIKKSVGEKFRVTILNPNPILYSYEIMYEEQKDKTEDKDVVTILGNLNGILQTMALGGLTTSNEYDAYKKAINNLVTDIKDAAKVLVDSDIPELPEEALSYKRAGGLRKAVDEITSNTTSTLFTNEPCRFHSADLSNDLTTLLGKVPNSDLDDVMKEA